MKKFNGCYDLFRFKKVDNTIVPIKKVKDNKVWLLEAKVNKE